MASFYDWLKRATLPPKPLRDFERKQLGGVLTKSSRVIGGVGAGAGAGFLTGGPLGAILGGTAGLGRGIKGVIENVPQPRLMYQSGVLGGIVGLAAQPSLVKTSELVKRAGPGAKDVGLADLLKVQSSYFAEGTQSLLSSALGGLQKAPGAIFKQSGSLLAGLLSGLGKGVSGAARGVGEGLGDAFSSPAQYAAGGGLFGLIQRGFNGAEDTARELVQGPPIIAPTVVLPSGETEAGAPLVGGFDLPEQLPAEISAESPGMSMPMILLLVAGAGAALWLARKKTA